MFTHRRIQGLVILGVASFLGTGTVLAADWFVDVNATGATSGGTCPMIPPQSWCDAFLNLQDALACASAGDIIRVAGGTYTPDTGGGQTVGDRSATFQLISGVTIEGGFAGCDAPLAPRDPSVFQTILSGDLLGNDAPNFVGNGDNSFHVVTGTNADATALLDGFTVTAGNANASSGNDRFGGGMLIVNSPAAPVVNDCTFRGNEATFGGGLLLINGATVIVTNSVFENNFASSQGGGMHATAQGPLPRIDNCTFRGNSSPTGGGLYVGQGGRVTSCLFTGNIATDGGGLFTIAVVDSFAMSGCTFSGNVANRGGGMHNSFGGPINRPNVWNSVFWGDSATLEGNEIWNFGSTPFLVSNDIQGSGGSGAGWDPLLGTDSGGNIDADPRFEDALGSDAVAGTADDDLRLRCGSPAIDTGDNFFVFSFMTTDLDGQPRIAGTSINMGAYESQPVGTGQVVISCPPDLTGGSAIECGGDTTPTATGAATALDDCTNASVTTTFVDTSIPGSGGTETITRTWSADDGSGGMVSCPQIISVVDTTNPTLSGVPADATAECDAVLSPANPTATDTCDPAPNLTFAETRANGTCADEYTLDRTWTATDGSNNATVAMQGISVDDTTPPAVTCPADLTRSGGFGGTAVVFDVTGIDNCDPAPFVSTDISSGSFFSTGVTTVTATGTDRCTNASACSFDVLVSCFGVNRAKIGTKDASCRGIEWIELTSMDGTEELISLYKAEEGSGGAEEDTLPPSIIVDDGVNGSVTIDTSCTAPVEIGDIFGPYTVSDVKKDFDDLDDDKGNEVEVRGSFVPAVPFDLALDDVTLSIDDGMGHAVTFVIPAGSFEISGKPENGKFKFEGDIVGTEVKAKLEECKFKINVKGATNAGSLVGTTMTIQLEIGANVGEETLVMQDNKNHLTFEKEPKLNCCPECEGIASMQVTSVAGVLTFVPETGQTELASNTVVDDGVNGPVTIHTSGLQPIDVGDVFGPYTVSEVVKIFDVE